MSHHIEETILIEYLHKIQDSKGAITKDYMTALSNLMGISQTEVYEVATFYHHFDVVESDKDKPPALTVRVCDSVSCEMNGANELAKILDDYYKGTVRIQKVPCIGRCQSAPAAVVKLNPVDNATFEKVKKVLMQKPTIQNYQNTSIMMNILKMVVIKFMNQYVRMILLLRKQ